MRKIAIAASLLLTSVLTLAVAFANTPSDAANLQATRRVRVSNNSSDIDTLIVRCVGIEPTDQFTLNVNRGQVQTENNAATGDRAIVFYEDFNSEIIRDAGGVALMRQFRLDPMGLNLRFVVTGDNAAGYNVAVAAEQ